MNKTHMIAAASSLSLFLGVALNEQVEARVKITKPTGIISMQDAIKVATKTIGDYVISTHLFTDSGGISYYRITVVDSEGEVKAVYVGANPARLVRLSNIP